MSWEFGKIVSTALEGCGEGMRENLLCDFPEIIKVFHIAFPYFIRF